jgi:hypothetical protein
MKNKILITILLMSTICFSQINLQDKDRFSIQITTDNVVFQKGIFYGGVEFQAEFSNGIYIRPQIHYADLKDGYLEIASGIGLNFASSVYDVRTNVFTGIKLGVINRSATNAIFGFESGVEVKVLPKVSLGIRGSYDFRGDAKFYEGKDWVYNSQGYIKFIIN